MRGRFPGRAKRLCRGLRFLWGCAYLRFPTPSWSQRRSQKLSNSCSYPSFLQPTITRHTTAIRTHTDWCVYVYGEREFSFGGRWEFEREIRPKLREFSVHMWYVGLLILTVKGEREWVAWQLGEQSKLVLLHSPHS